MRPTYKKWWQGNAPSINLMHKNWMAVRLDKKISSTPSHNSLQNPFLTFHKQFMHCHDHRISQFFHLSSIVIKDTVSHAFSSSTFSLGCFSSSRQNSKDQWLWPLKLRNKQVSCFQLGIEHGLCYPCSIWTWLLLQSRLLSSMMKTALQRILAGLKSHKAWTFWGRNQFWDSNVGFGDLKGFILRTSLSWARVLIDECDNISGRHLNRGIE